MSSSSNRNPWPPYDSYKDCSLGICSIYCPQFCYVIFPPPPPSNSDTDDDTSGSTFFSPLVIAVIGILASVFLMVTYYLVATRYGHRRNRSDRVSDEINESTVAAAVTAAGASGVDETVIKAITVFKYKKGDGVVEGTECSVCLSQFEENQSLRLMPKCTHAFHLPCIDTWLASHSSCPLCRSSVVELLSPPAPAPAPAPMASPLTVTSSSSSAHAPRHQGDSVLIICDFSGSGVQTMHLPKIQFQE